jgi:hypothetical protein
VLVRFLCKVLPPFENFIVRSVIRPNRESLPASDLLTEFVDFHVISIAMMAIIVAVIPNLMVMVSLTKTSQYTSAYN